MQKNTLEIIAIKIMLQTSKKSKRGSMIVTVLFVIVIYINNSMKPRNGGRVDHKAITK